MITCFLLTTKRYLIFFFFNFIQNLILPYFGTILDLRKRTHNKNFFSQRVYLYANLLQFLFFFLFLKTMSTNFLFGLVWLGLKAIDWKTDQRDISFHG